MRRVDLHTQIVSSQTVVNVLSTQLNAQYSVVVDWVTTFLHLSTTSKSSAELTSRLSLVVGDQFSNIVYIVVPHFSGLFHSCTSQVVLDV